MGNDSLHRQGKLENNLPELIIININIVCIYLSISSHVPELCIQIPFLHRNIYVLNARWTKFEYKWVFVYTIITLKQITSSDLILLVDYLEMWNVKIKRSYSDYIEMPRNDKMYDYFPY